MATTMKAWRTYKYNEDVPAAIGALKLETDVPVPTPGAGEVRVKVLHAAVNPIDWKLFSGGYHSMCPATFPFVPGFDLSLRAWVPTWSSTTRLKIGRRSSRASNMK